MNLREAIETWRQKLARESARDLSTVVLPGSSPMRGRGEFPGSATPSPRGVVKRICQQHRLQPK